MIGGVTYNMGGGLTAFSLRRALSSIEKDLEQN
jgi:hypothetical protein